MIPTDRLDLRPPHRRLARRRPERRPGDALPSVLSALPTVRQRRVVGGRWWPRSVDRQRLAIGLGGLVAGGAGDLRGRDDRAPRRSGRAIGDDDRLARRHLVAVPDGAGRVIRDAAVPLHIQPILGAAIRPTGPSTAPPPPGCPPIGDVIQAAAMDVFAPAPNARGIVAASTEAARWARDGRVDRANPAAETESGPALVRQPERRRDLVGPPAGGVGRDRAARSRGARTGQLLRDRCGRARRSPCLPLHGRVAQTCDDAAGRIAPRSMRSSPRSPSTTDVAAASTPTGAARADAGRG